MLLTTYHLDIVNNHCMPGAMSVNAVARLDQDVGRAIPYLNAVLGGRQYIKDPPAVTFQAHGKLISVQARKITVNALKDRAQAEKIMEWMKQEINTAWKERETITPSHEGMGQPQFPKLLKHLPATNCRDCKEATCMVFALCLAQGARGPDDCPHLTNEDKKALTRYLAAFEPDL